MSIEKTNLTANINGNLQTTPKNLHQNITQTSSDVNVNTKMENNNTTIINSINTLTNHAITTITESAAFKMIKDKFTGENISWTAIKTLQASIDIGEQLLTLNSLLNTNPTALAIYLFFLSGQSIVKYINTNNQSTNNESSTKTIKSTSQAIKDAIIGKVHGNFALDSKLRQVNTLIDAADDINQLITAPLWKKLYIIGKQCLNWTVDIHEEMQLSAN